MTSPPFFSKLKIFFEKYINALTKLFFTKIDITPIEKFFLFTYLVCIFIYLFIGLSKGCLICIVFKILIAVCLIIAIFFILKKIIYYLLDDIENVFEESYFFNLTKEYSNTNISEFKNFKICIFIKVIMKFR